MTTSVAQGPLLPVQRVVLPGTARYVEVRQERSPRGVIYVIEQGSVRNGHQGHWGRDNALAALSCFSDAIALWVSP